MLFQCISCPKGTLYQKKHITKWCRRNIARTANAAEGLKLTLCEEFCGAKEVPQNMPQYCKKNISQQITTNIQIWRLLEHFLLRLILSLISLHGGWETQLVLLQRHGVRVPDRIFHPRAKVPGRAPQMVAEGVLGPVHRDSHLIRRLLHHAGENWCHFVKDFSVFLRLEKGNLDGKFRLAKACLYL